MSENDTNGQIQEDAREQHAAQASAQDAPEADAAESSTPDLDLDRHSACVLFAHPSDGFADACGLEPLAQPTPHPVAVRS